MKGQPPGLSQYQLTQQSNYEDMQLWQQQMMYNKQLQEFQRQQQIQQLGQESQQPSIISHIPALTRNSSASQLPIPVNGMPLHGVALNSWPDEYARNNPKMPYSSQMISAGSASLTPTIGSSNINGFTNGLMLSPDQCQTLQSMGNAPQQAEQSLYGMPVSSVGNSSNQFSQFHGLSQDSSGSMAGPVPNRPANIMAQSAFTSFQGNRGAYVNQNFMQNSSSLISTQEAQGKVNSGRMSSGALTDGYGNFQQMNPPDSSLQVQDSHVRHDHTDLQRKYQEKEAPRANIHSSTSLDPTEQKILFSSDEDTDWMSTLMGGSTSSGGYVSKNPPEGPDLLSSFSSFHSGSWSALMQSAVAEVSSSDTGLQDDWKGMSSKQRDIHSQDRNTVPSDTRQLPLSGNKLHTQSSLTLDPNSLGNDDATASKKSSSFQQSSSRFTNDLERVHVDTSHENNRDKFHQNFYRKDDTQSGQVYERAVLDTKSAENAALSLNNLESSSAHKQNLSLYMSSGQFNGSRYGNNSSGFQLPSIQMTSKVSAAENMKQPDQSGGTLRHLNAQGNYGINMSNTGPNQLGGLSHMQSGVLNSNFPKQNEDVNQPHNQNFDHGQNVFSKAGENSGDSNQIPNKGLQVWGTHGSNSYKAPADFPERKPVNHPNADNSSNTGFVAGIAHDLQNFVTGNQKSEHLTSNQISSSQNFRNNPLERIDWASLNDAQKQMLYAHMLRGAKMQSQELLKHAVPNNSLNVDMSRGSDSQGNARNPSDVHVRSSGSNHYNNNQDSRVTVPFEKSTTALPLSSQNAVQLLHKVDQSRSNDIVNSFGVNQSLSSNSNAPVASGAFTTDLRHVQNSSMPGFGLRLAPPSQLGPIPSKGHSYSGTSQTNYDDNSEKCGSEVEDKQTTWSNSSIHFPSTRPSLDASKNVVFDTRTSMQVNSSAATPASPSYTSNQLQLAQIGGAIGQISTQKETDSHRTPNGSCRSTADGSPQSSVPDPANRFQSFRLASSSGLVNCQSVPIDSTPYAQNSPHLSLPQPQNIVQSSPLFVTPQHGGFSGMSNHAWSTQQLASNLSVKTIPLQSTSPKHVQMMTIVQSEVAKRDTDTAEGAQLMDAEGNQHVGEEMESGRSFRQQLLSENRRFNSQSASVSQEQETLRSQASEGSSLPCSANENDEVKGKNESNISSEQKVDQALMHDVTSNRDVRGFHYKQTPSHGHHYSLLQQMQAMKALEANSSNLFDKRIRGTDNYADPKRLVGSLPQSHNVIYGHKLPGKSASDGELSAVVQQNLFPSNSKMLTFSSMGTNAQVLASSRQNDIQINSPAPISSSAFSTAGGLEPRRISPQMAPSWFGQCGAPRPSNAAAIYNGSENSQIKLKVAAEQNMTVNSSGNINSIIEPTRNDDTTQNDYSSKAGVATVGAGDVSAVVHTVSSDICDQNLLPKTKKRKSMELVPWHKEIKLVSNKLESNRNARVSWAKATNRLLEKVEDEVETRDDFSRMHRMRRRLLMTTQLMQELMPLLPARLLVEPTTTSYEKIPYLIAKLGLGDACGLLSRLEEAHQLPSEAGSLRSGKVKISEKWIDKRFVKVLENFIGRSKKLESDLLRLEKKAPLLDVRLECQELERFSIINRFAKFHGGSQLSGGFESSSTPEPSHKIFPQRFVTALSIPGNNLEGVICLSL